MLLVIAGWSLTVKSLDVCDDVCGLIFYPFNLKHIRIPLMKKEVH